jgi:ribosomal protein S18 acetylase RimI-like enzyme
MEITMIHSRAFEDENDLLALRALLVDARRIAGHNAGYWHIGDLTWRHCIWFRAQDYRLWFDNDQLIGFAVFTDFFYYYWQIHPYYLWRGVEEEMLAWVERCRTVAMNDGSIPSERKRRLVASAFENDSQRIAFLERNGFIQGEDLTIHFACALTESSAHPQQSDGFTLRGMEGLHQAPQRAEAHRQAFRSSYVTDDGYCKLMQMAEYNRELDVVSVASDGTIAAYAMSWVDVENKIGEFEPIGARPAFQRQGLTRAALLEGMRRMKARGAETAIVCTDGSNGEARCLYESVGFRVIYREWNYVKRDA